MSDEDRQYLSGMLLGLVVGVMGTMAVLGMSGEFYQDGQRDALNGVWKYQKVTTSDGVVHFIEVTTQPSK